MYLRDLHFARPELLALLGGALLVVALLWWLKPRRHLTHSMVARPPILSRLRASHLRWLPRLFYLLAFLLVGLCLLEPRISYREGVTRLEGLDIVMVVDLSSSMHEILGGWEKQQQVYETLARAKGNTQGLELPETRMEAVKKAMIEFVNQRKNDRLALIIFSENSYVVTPFTTDHSYLKKHIRMLDPNMLIGEGMTAIGEGIATAVDLFRRENDPETRNKVIVVFTDGEHNFGRDPIDVLSTARFYGYRVYLIGVELDAQVTAKEKVQRLIRAVEYSGGRYFDAKDQRELEQAYQSIDQTEKAMFVQKSIEMNIPAYQAFALLSLVLLLLGLLLNSLPYFVEIS